MANVKTPEFRAAYVNVFKPKMNDMSKKEEYSLVALFKPGTDFTGLKKMAEDAAIKKFGSDKTQWPKLRSPFRVHEDMEKGGKLPDGYEKGGIFINLKNAKSKPGIVKVGDNGEVVDIVDPTEFYSGCYGIATVSCYGYDFNGNRGVAFGLQNIFKTKDGAHMDGRVDAAADFADVRGQAKPVTGSAADMFS